MVISVRLRSTTGIMKANTVLRKAPCPGMRPKWPRLEHGLFDSFGACLARRTPNYPLATAHGDEALVDGVGRVTTLRAHNDNPASRSTAGGCETLGCETSMTLAN